MYRRHFWPEHDRANRAWIAATAARLETIAAPAIARLEQIYDTRWFTAPVRVDVVWVGTWEPYLEGKVTSDAAVAATMAGLSQ